MEHKEKTAGLSPKSQGPEKDCCKNASHKDIYKIVS